MSKKVRLQHATIRNSSIVLVGGEVAQFDAHGVSAPVKAETAELTVAVPGFSLYSGERFEDEDRTLFERAIDNLKVLASRLGIPVVLRTGDEALATPELKTALEADIDQPPSLQTPPEGTPEPQETPPVVLEPVQPTVFLPEPVAPEVPVVADRETGEVVTPAPEPASSTEEVQPVAVESQPLSDQIKVQKIRGAAKAAAEKAEAKAAETATDAVE